MQKQSSSKVKSEDNACVFLRQGNYSPRVCPWGTNYHLKFLFEYSGTPLEEDSPCPAWVLSARHLVSSSRQCTGLACSCCTSIFSSKTSVRTPSSALLPWFIPLLLVYIPQTEVTIERAHVWRCSTHPSSCDIESLGHTTRRHAEVLPVFARSCHSLYRCRRDVLWIKCRLVLKSFVSVLFYNLSLIT